MSDLIRRKKISDYIKGEINSYGKPFEGTAYELGLKIMRYIDAMDSDYDVGKVVEKLEEIKGSACDGKSCSECEYTSDCLEGEQSEKVAIDKAIEIVKQGSVDDDVCEWNGEKSRLATYTRFTTACGYNFDLETNNELLKAFRYCPFCGKKIKVVE